MPPKAVRPPWGLSCRERRSSLALFRAYAAMPSNLSSKALDEMVNLAILTALDYVVFDLSCHRFLLRSFWRTLKSIKFFLVMLPSSWRTKTVKIEKLLLVLIAAFILGIGTAEPAPAWWRGGWGGAGGWHGGVAAGMVAAGMVEAGDMAAAARRRLGDRRLGGARGGRGRGFGFNLFLSRLWLRAAAHL